MPIPQTKIEIAMSMNIADRGIRYLPVPDDLARFFWRFVIFCEAILSYSDTCPLAQLVNTLGN